METFELKYFVAVAQDQSVHRASDKLRVSPGSLSKAVGRLEEELGVPLFYRDGRGIRLTDQGELLKRKALQILEMEEEARLAVSGARGTIHCLMAGPEVLLSEMGVSISKEILKRHPNTVFELSRLDEAGALAGVRSGDYHLAITTLDPPKGLTSKILATPVFQTCVGPGHPLWSAARSKKTLPIDEVLKHRFVSSKHSLFGQVGVRQSMDGWRDDQFPRQVGYVTSSLQTLSAWVMSGEAVAYLPDYYIAHIGAAVIKMSGCPYSCHQKVRLVTRDPDSRGWIKQLF